MCLAAKAQRLEAALAMERRRSAQLEVALQTAEARLRVLEPLQ